MPKLNILGLRWLLVLGNLAVLTLVSWLTYSFIFANQENELKGELPTTNKFEIKIGVRIGGTRDQLEKVIQIFCQPLTPVVSNEGPETLQQPPREGGPLQDWEVTSLIYYEGAPYAFLKETVEKSVGTNPRGKRRPRGPRLAPKSKTEFVGVGWEFLVDGNVYWVQEIADDPPRVIYRDEGNQRYNLVKKEESSKTYLQAPDGTVRLKGLVPDELDALATGKVKNAPQIRPDRRWRNHRP